MFEKILQQLKTRYKDLGLSETILKVMAEKLALTVKEETEIESSIETVAGEMKIFQSFADQQRTLQAEIKKLAEAKPEEKKPEVKPEEVKPEEGEKVPAWAQALLDANKTLTDDLNNFKAEKSNQSNAEKLTSKFKELGVNENFYNLQMQGKTFQNDEEIEAFATSVKDAEDAYLQSTNNTRLAAMSPPKFGGADVEGEVSSDVKNFITTNYKKDETN